MAIDFSIGRWAVPSGYSGRLSASKYDVLQITQVTPKLIKGLRLSRLEQKPKDSVMATFGTEAEALSLIDKITGINGERIKRHRAADEAAEKALSALLGELTT